MALFDTHCHLGYDPQTQNYDADSAAAEHGRAVAAGVTEMLLVGIDAATSQAARNLASVLDGVHWTAGLHPCSADRWSQEQATIASLARDPACVAIGESGVDLFHDRAPLNQQIDSFAEHLALAAEFAKPIVIHCRDGYDDTYRTVRQGPRVSGVMHCFSGDRARAEQALELDLYLSLRRPPDLSAQPRATRSGCRGSRRTATG